MLISANLRRCRLIGKVAADHGHKWVFQEAQEQETINLIASWSSSADSVSISSTNQIHMLTITIPVVRLHNANERSITCFLFFYTCMWFVICSNLGHGRLSSTVVLRYVDTISRVALNEKLRVLKSWRPCLIVSPADHCSDRRQRRRCAAWLHEEGALERHRGCVIDLGCP
jgi:hypothetical protein